MSARRVAIVGGGLAGMGAAAGLAGRGFDITLYEARRKLGGRAGSYLDPESGQWIDHCQHVAMGCCTNFLDFCRRTGVVDCLERHPRLHFFGPDGRQIDFAASRWLPPPLHLLPALFGLTYLSFGDKLSIGRAMRRLVRERPGPGQPDQVASDWLVAQRQSPAAIERFWQVVLVSALGESLDRVSISAARKVFLDGFLANRNASDVLLPRCSLHELYDQRVASSLESEGITIRRGLAIDKLRMEQERVAGLIASGGEMIDCDVAILAVPWTRLNALLPSSALGQFDPAGRIAQIAAAPISGVHLWFDRPLTALPHAVLVGRLAQWVFARTAASASGEHYYQVVISASHELAARPRNEVVENVVRDLCTVFPAAASAMLIRSKLITDHEAVFSVRPGVEAARPTQRTPVPGLLLAGDWTSTGWPATMEGAVRSGYLAAEAALAELGKPEKLPEKLIVPDLPRGWLLRLAGVV